MLDLIFLVIVLCGTGLLIALLSTEKRTRLPNLMLALMVVLVMMNNGLRYLLLSEHYKFYGYLAKTWYVSNALTGPVFYFFIMSLIDARFKFRPRHLLHLLPMTGFLLYTIPHYFIPLKDHVSQIASYEVEFHAVIGVQIMFDVFYLCMCIYQAYLYEQRCKNETSNIDHIRHAWLRFTLPMVSLIVFLLAAFYLFGGRSSDLEMFNLLLASIFFYGLVIFCLRQSRNIEWEATEPEKVSNNFPPMSEVDLSRHMEKLEAYIAAEKPFKNPNLKILDLAKGLRMQSYLLSKVINTGYGKNFYRFINGYRIDEAKRCLLKNSSGQKIIDVAYEVGFNSKSTFNGTFKEITGVTPSHFVAANSN